MGTDIEKEAPNVVTTKHFHELLRSGYLAEIVCTQAAYKKAAVWYGEWIVRVVNADGTFEKLVSSTRQPATAKENIRIRTAKTANGLISFLHAAGFTHPVVPLEEGGRHVLELPEHLQTGGDPDMDGD
jgi:hypothetical protein